MGISFVLSNRREHRRSLAICDRKEVAHLGAFKNARFCRGAGKNVRKLEKAVAVSGVCSGLLTRNSGKVQGKFLENFSRIEKC